MIRKIIKIDENLCNGCGLCAKACHEGAIEMFNGRARLMRDDYCDGLGDCLPACPTGAISFEQREAAAYNAQAVHSKQTANQDITLECGCPGTHSRVITRQETARQVKACAKSERSCLNQWPVQLRLAPVNATYFSGASLLIAADCAAYAYASFHADFMRNKITLIGCPKLDNIDYAEKLTEILKHNDIKQLTIVRMEVPCCGGLENAVKASLSACGKKLPWQAVTLSTSGEALNKIS